MPHQRVEGRIHLILHILSSAPEMQKWQWALHLIQNGSLLTNPANGLFSTMVMLFFALLA
jgi:hypothetical protein